MRTDGGDNLSSSLADVPIRDASDNDRLGPPHSHGTTLIGRAVVETSRDKPRPLPIVAGFKGALAGV